MTIFNLLLLVLVLVFSTESMDAPGGSSSPTVSYEYDELLLVLQWPTSFCNTHYCDYPIPDKFTVHGLWLNKNSFPVNCNKPNARIKLSPKISGGLRKDMEKYWPDLQNQKYPENFWVREHATHGSCFTEFRDQVDYFQTALAIAKEIGDVMTMLLSSGQALKIGQRYQVKDFDPVNIAGRTFNPSLRCNKVKGRRYPQLQEIVFCTDTNMEPKNCTSEWKVCSGEFEFPQVPESCPAPPFTYIVGNLVRDSEPALNLRGS